MCLTLVSGPQAAAPRGPIQHGTVELLGDLDELENGRRRMASSSVAPARNAEDGALLKMAHKTTAAAATVGVVDVDNHS